MAVIRGREGPLGGGPLRSDLFGLQAVQVIRRTLSMASGGKDEALLALQQGE